RIVETVDDVPAQEARGISDVGCRLGIADEVEAVGIVVEAVTRAEEQPVLATRERDDAAATDPANLVERRRMGVLEAVCGTDIGEVDPVRRGGDADSDDVAVRASRLARVVIGERKAWRWWASVRIAVGDRVKLLRDIDDGRERSDLCRTEDGIR